MSTLRDEFYQQADRFFLGVTSALFGVSLLLANWYNTWTEALVIGLPAVLVPYLVSKLSPGSRLSRIAYAAALMILTGLHIHQAHGLLEMHFGIFCPAGTAAVLPRFPAHSGRCWRYCGAPFAV